MVNCVLFDITSGYLYVIRAFFPIWSNVFHSGDGKITPENDVSSISCSDTVTKNKENTKNNYYKKKASVSEASNFCKYKQGRKIRSFCATKIRCVDCWPETKQKEMQTKITSN